MEEPGTGTLAELGEFGLIERIIDQEDLLLYVTHLGTPGSDVFVFDFFAINVDASFVLSQKAKQYVHQGCFPGT